MTEGGDNFTENSPAWTMMFKAGWDTVNVCVKWWKNSKTFVPLMGLSVTYCHNNAT